MTVFDENRLTHAPYRFDLDAIRRGDFSDQYFGNVRTILTWLSQHHEEAIYSTNPRQLPLDPHSVAIGDIEVQAQVFNRRAPYALVGGVDVALYLLRHDRGYYEGETFIETWQNLQVRAVLDGVITPYEGNPLNVLP
ncbi:MAG: nicotinate phosphoribosyltransferase, partial [Phototrophicaceae bacterium]